MSKKAEVGKLKPATRAARTGRNPHTEQAIDLPEKETVKLVVSTRY
ncbi:MAG: HU family DNA-binding protein [Bacilli bacterium]